MKISMSATRLNNSHLKLVYSISNVIFAFLLIAPLSSWGTACDLSVSSEEGLRSALISCEGQDGGTIHLESDISASKGEFSYIGYGGGNLKINGNGHSISVPNGSEWRILRFGGGGLLTIENITLANGTARGYGGAIYVPSGSLFVNNSTIIGNKSVHSSSNGEECAGGAIAASGPIRVVASRIIGNKAGGPLPSISINCGGGAIVGNSVTIIESTLSENSAGNFDDQTSGFGGAVYCGASCLIVDSMIMNNSSNFGAGGGIYAYGDLTITNSIIKENKAFGDRYNGGHGGGIYGADDNKLLISQSIIIGNESESDGGGIGWIGSIEINHSTVRNNVSTRSNGGGIAYLGSSVYQTPNGPLPIASLTIKESIITENKAGARGGGIFSLGEILINTSTIMDNSAKARGGGAYVFNPEASLSINYKNTINNSTITRNRARDGGGIATDSDSPGKISMNFTTISSNYSSVGGANLSSSFSVLLKGSVITDPLGSRRNCSNKVTASSSYSIEGSSLNSCGLNRGQGNKIAPISAIALGALGDNGGPTPTMLPSSSSILFTSAAPDGLGSGIMEDQRLFNRSGPFTIGSVQLLSHEITPYVFEGFFKPVSNINWNNIKLKSIVPVRWRLSDSKSGRLITDPASVTSKTYIRIDCSSGLDYPGATEIQAKGAAVVWKKASRRFEFKWKPPFAVGECMRLDFRFSDNQTHSAKFFIMKPN